MNLTDLKTFYSGLLIIQYKMKPRAIATIKLLTNQAWCDGLPMAMQTAFDLDTALGAQLDILGRIVGVPRSVYGLDLYHTFMEFSDYDGAPGVGWGQYSDSPYPDQLWLRYNTDASYTLSDAEMLGLIKLKIIYNTNPMTLKSLKDALFYTFDGAIDVVDNLDMTATYHVFSPYVNMMSVAEYLGIIPKPMGVEITITNPSSLLLEDGTRILTEGGEVLDAE